MMPKVEVRIISDDDEVGRRLDNYLLTYLKKVPRELIYRIIRKGEVRVNRRRIKQGYRLQLGDAVRIPPIRTREQTPIKLKDDLRELIESSIIFEDDYLICFNKPAGLAVHGGSSLNFGLIEAVRECRENSKYELAHRIDRDTSGCLIVCKNRESLRWVQEVFKDRQVSKVYEFFSDMSCAVGAATLTITRAGASSLAELAAAGVPSIIIPLPGSVDQHQLANAAAVVKSGGGVLIEERQTSPDQLASIISGIITDRKRRESMSLSMRQLDRPQAAIVIAKRIMKLM